MKFTSLSRLRLDGAARSTTLTERMVVAASSRSRWLKLAGLCVGIIALLLVFRFVGAADVRAALARGARWLPLAFALEATRIPLELLVTWRLLGEVAIDRAALPRVIRTHLLFYAMSIAVPGGRPVAEVGKANGLAPWLGAPKAAALSTATQGVAFVADAIFAGICTVAAYLSTGPSLLTLVLGLLASGTFGLWGLSFRASRSARWALSLKRFPSLAQRLTHYREAAERQQMLSASSLSIMCASRASQVGLFGVLFYAITGATSLSQAFIGLSLAMLGSVAGDAIPGQLGVTDTVFVLASRPLGHSAAAFTSVAVLFHAVQLLVAAAASMLALTCFNPVAPARPNGPRGASEQASR